MLLFNRPLGSRLTLPAIDDPPIHFCNSLSISQELCLRSSLESQSSTSASADPVLGFQPIKTQKLGFTTQKIRAQFAFSSRRYVRSLLFQSFDFPKGKLLHLRCSQKKTTPISKQIFVEPPVCLLASTLEYELVISPIRCQKFHKK